MLTVTSQDVTYFQHEIHTAIFAVYNYGSIFIMTNIGALLINGPEA